MASNLVPPLKRAYAQSTLKLNVGPGGRFKKSGWTTLDHYLANADVHCDLRESPRLPFADSSFSKVYCSHVIEHLDDAAVDSLFRECFRILRADGVLRISCPDVEKAIAQHRAGLCDPDGEVLTSTMKASPSHLRLLNVFASFKAPSYQGIRNALDDTIYSGGPVASPEEVEEHLARDSLEEFARWAHGLIPTDATYKAHINAFWPARVKAKLLDAGFSRVMDSTFRGSIDEELRGEKFDNRPAISLFVEARPGGIAKSIVGSWGMMTRTTKKLFELWGAPSPSARSGPDAP